MIRPTRSLQAAAALALAALTPSAASAQPVDLELSLLLDSSISVSDERFAIEINAVADLVEDPVVIPQDGSVALNLVLYATRASEAIPFTRITSAADAASLASAIRAVPRQCCRTGLADGIRVATASIETNSFEGRRKVIDVAGNGVENGGARLDLARADALLVVDAINGLPITDGEPNLLSYYQTEVIGGSGAFAYEVRVWDDFKGALRAKLLREVERCAPPLDGLVAWWSFEREVLNAECDVAGEHAALRLGCPNREPGRFGDALRFDGADDALLVLPAADLAGAAGLSAMTWLRTTASVGDAAVLDRRDTDGQGWRLSIQNGLPRVMIVSGTSSVDLVSSTAVDDDAWHHVSFTLNADAGAWRVDLVVDGVSTATGSLAQPPPALDVELLVGADALDANAPRFAGLLDDVQVFGRGLSLAEAAFLANLPLGGQCGWIAGCADAAFETQRCLWAPNHSLACFSDASVLLPDLPAAHGLPIHVLDCRSDQPDDVGGRAAGRPWYWRFFEGDGNTANDCVIAPDRSSFCVRVERSGRRRASREYVVTLTLDCGAFTYSPSTLRLTVPHDMRDNPDCNGGGRSER